MNRLAYCVIALALLLGAGASLFFIVDQREYAVVSSMGGLKHVIETPGLHVKWPAPLEQVTFVDRRVQMLSVPQNIRFPVNSKENIALNVQVKWRISDPRTYFLHYRQDAKRAETEIGERIKAQLTALSEQRASSIRITTDYDALAHAVYTALQENNPNSSKLYKGIEILSIYLQRTDSSTANTPKREQIIADKRAQILATLRTQSAAEVEALRLEVLRKRDQILSDAYEQARIIEAEGDAKAADIEADAARSAPGFYAFYKDLQTLRRTTNEQDMLIVDPLSDLKTNSKSPSLEMPKHR